MTASVVSRVEVSHLSKDSLRRIGALLVSESRAQAARYAEHEAMVSQLRGQTDADSVLERELAEMGAIRAQEAIGDVQHAMERLAIGSYGWCEACGTAVPFERLEAIPSARSCTACAGRRAGWAR